MSIDKIDVPSGSTVNFGNVKLAIQGMLEAIATPECYLHITSVELKKLSGFVESNSYGWVRRTALDAEMAIRDQHTEDASYDVRELAILNALSAVNSWAALMTQYFLDSSNARAIALVQEIIFSIAYAECYSGDDPQGATAQAEFVALIYSCFDLIFEIDPVQAYREETRQALAGCHFSIFAGGAEAKMGEIVDVDVEREVWGESGSAEIPTDDFFFPSRGSITFTATDGSCHKFAPGPLSQKDGSARYNDLENPERYALVYKPEQLTAEKLEPVLAAIDEALPDYPIERDVLKMVVYLLQGNIALAQALSLEDWLANQTKDLRLCISTLSDEGKARLEAHQREHEE